MTITRAGRKPRPASSEGTVSPTAEAFIAEAPHREEQARSAAAELAPDATAGSVPDTDAASARRARARGIIRKHLPWAAAAGAVPIPAVDLATIIGVQLRMLSEVGAQYDVPFKAEAARTFAGTLMASVLQSGLAGGLASMLKVVPGLGTAVGILALPALAAAGTQALGMVFITHFESGGTFLDFDPDRIERHFREEFERSRSRPKT